MPTDIGVHDLTSSTSHSPFVATASSNYFANPPWKAFDDSAGADFWIGQGGAVDFLKLNRGGATAFFSDYLPHDLSSPTSHSPFVVAASSQHGSFPKQNALDGSLSSYWLGVNAGVDWWSIDLGSGNDQTIRSYWITVNDVPEPARAPKDWTFEGSPDNSSWTVLDTRTNQSSWDNNETRYYEPTDVSTAYRYFRINITANNGDATFTQLAEVHMFTTALDRSRNKVCGSYKVKVASNASRDPKDWTFEGNKFEGGGWVVLDTQTGQTSWSNNEERTFTCAGGGAAYQAFRINITANNGDGTYTELAELTLLEGATTINESFSLDVSAGYTPAAQLAAAGAFSLAVTADQADATQLAGRNTIALAVQSGISAASNITGRNTIALAVQSGITIGTNAALTIGMTIAVGGLDLAFRRFQDADFALHVGLALEFLEGSANVNPGTFRPDGPSGPANIFRAYDAGDVPGVFRPGSSSGTPGIFKPTE